jgi:hypothetical protein
MITRPDAYLAFPTDSSATARQRAQLKAVGTKPSSVLVELDVVFVDGLGEVVGRGIIEGKVETVITVADGVKLLVFSTGERVALTHIFR